MKQRQRKTEHTQDRKKEQTTEHTTCRTQHNKHGAAQQKDRQKT